MAYTLTQAARASGKGKSTLLRAIRSGRISASRDEVAGSWLIDESELHRIFAPVPAVPGADPVNGAPRTPDRTDRTAELEARIAEMQEAARLRDDTIADLRRRLDGEAEERRRLTALLADRTSATAPSAQSRRSWWPWRR